ncbi:unnamed protein product, partial [Meganyctiphanes norvegica]
MEDRRRYRLKMANHTNFFVIHAKLISTQDFIFVKGTLHEANLNFLLKCPFSPSRQQTYTPRLLIIDAKGSLGSLPHIDSLYNPLRPDISINEAAWEGKVELIRQLADEKNEYLKELEAEEAKYNNSVRDEDKDICIEDFTAHQGVSGGSNTQTEKTKKVYNLSNDVKVWSDFLYPHLHPSTLYILEDVCLQEKGASGSGSGSSAWGGSALGGSAWGYAAGAALMQREDIEEGIADKIRLLSESCDSLQGFQVLGDISDGMGGITYGTLEHISDEYSRKAVLTYAITPPHLSPPTPETNAITRASIVQAYSQLSKVSHTLIPINLRSSLWNPSVPGCKWSNLEFDIMNPYESSSIIATYLDTVTMLYRRKSNALNLGSVCDLLTPGGRKVAGGRMALPLGLPDNECLFEWLQKGESPQMTSLTSGADLTCDPVSEGRVIRGVPNKLLVRRDTRLPPGVRFNSACQLYEDYLNECQTPPSTRVMAGVCDIIKTTTPFPSIFTKAVTQSGFIAVEPEDGIKEVLSIPTMATLTQSVSVAWKLQELISKAEKLDVNKVSRLVKEGVDRETWDTVVDDLKSLISYYEIGNNVEMNSSGDDS